VVSGSKTTSLGRFSMTIKRRHMTARQRAMATAVIYPESE
jgi:hypothetical protein